MSPVATVLYEDSMIGREFPLHHLVMRMVEDEIDGQTWRLRQAVDPIPKKGVDKVLADARDTALIAGAGRLFLLVDRDRIVVHLNQNARDDEPALAEEAADEQVVDAILRRSDAPQKLAVFFLCPNMEGLVACLGRCAPGVRAKEIAEAIQKDRVARDLVLGEFSKAAMAAVRTCVRAAQPGLDGLASALATILSDALA